MIECMKDKKAINKAMEKIIPKISGEKHYHFRHDIKNEAIIKLVQEGLTVTQIAKKLNCHNKMLIVKRVKKLGLKVTISNKEGKTNPRYRHEITDKKIIEMLQNDIKIKAISEKFNCNDSTIRKRLKKMNLKKEVTNVK